jgi:hypothetical protein
MIRNQQSACLFGRALLLFSDAMVAQEFDGARERFSVLAGGEDAAGLQDAFATWP